MLASRFSGVAIVHVRPVGDEQLCDGKHVALQLGAKLEVTREGKMQDGTARADFAQRRLGVAGEPGLDGGAVVERHLEVELSDRQVGIGRHDPVDHPALPEIERHLLPLAQGGAVHRRRLGGEFQLGPAFMPLLDGDHMERIGVLRHARLWQYGTDTGDGFALSGGERPLQLLGLTAQFLNG